MLKPFSQTCLFFLLSVPSLPLLADTTITVPLDSTINQTYTCNLEGQVVKVSDGDTITVLDSNKTQHKVRLAGIDAPEKSRILAMLPKKH